MFNLNSIEYTTKTRYSMFKLPLDWELRGWEEPPLVCSLLGCPAASPAVVIQPGMVSGGQIFQFAV